MPKSSLDVKFEKEGKRLSGEKYEKLGNLLAERFEEKGENINRINNGFITAGYLLIGMGVPSAAAIFGQDSFEKAIGIFFGGGVFGSIFFGIGVGLINYIGEKNLTNKMKDYLKRERLDYDFDINII